VLVEHPNGRPFSDGRIYKIYYVPIGWLQPVAHSDDAERREQANAS
jgi:hypothetical protein